MKNITVSPAAGNVASFEAKYAEYSFVPSSDTAAIHARSWITKAAADAARQKGKQAETVAIIHSSVSRSGLTGYCTIEMYGKIQYGAEPLMGPMVLDGSGLQMQATAEQVHSIRTMQAIGAMNEALSDTSRQLQQNAQNNQTNAQLQMLNTNIQQNTQAINNLHGTQYLR